VTDRCVIAGCRGAVEIVYLDRGLCDRHWNELMADDASRTRLRMGLGLDETMSPALEVDMSETETTATAAENAAGETTVATKSKSTRKARTKAAKPAKQVKAVKPKKERASKGPVPGRVFAFRCTTPELEAIHRTAGPRNASQFIRSVAAAFAAEDHAAFKAVIEEARKLRG